MGFSSAPREINQRVRARIWARGTGPGLDCLSRAQAFQRRTDLLRELPRRRDADGDAEFQPERHANRRAVLFVPAPRVRWLPEYHGAPREQRGALARSPREEWLLPDHEPDAAHSRGRADAQPANQKIQ